MLLSGIFSDRDSWLGARNYPLPYDENYKAKRVYSIIKDFDPASDTAVVKEDFHPSVLNQPDSNILWSIRKDTPASV